MYLVLGIDPGVSTGYCLFEVQDISPELTGAPKFSTEIKESGVIHSGDLDDSCLVSYSDFIHEFDVLVVIEKIPTPMAGPLHDELERVTRWLAEKFPTAKMIPPSQWKPVMKNFEFASPIHSIHARDAFKMAFYYVRYIQRKGK